MPSKKKKGKEAFSVKQLQLDNEVTGSAMIVECDGQTILVNYGMHQDNKTPIDKLYDIHREKMRIPIDRLDCCILPESHNDHVGLTAILGREDVDFNGVVYGTEPTLELARLILLDSAHIMESEAQKYNLNVKEKKKLKPLYTKDDVDRLMTLTRGYGYEQEIFLTPNLKFEFLPNGHILGSSMVYFTYDDGQVVKRLLITSDLYKGAHPRPFTKSIINKCLKANVIVIESTYGGRYHSNLNPIDTLEKMIEEYVVDKNKILFMPTFAQSRSSTMYYMLNEIWKRNSKIREANIPVYFCGNLMNECHQIYGKDSYDEFKDEQWIGHKELFNEKCGFKALKQFTDVDTFAIRGNHRRIILSSSGMVTGGYSLGIASRLVTNDKAVFLGLGYIGEGSVGHELLRQDNKSVLIEGSLKTKRMQSLGTLPNMSSHADTNGLVEFVKSCNQHVLQKVLIQHGDEEERKALKKELESNLNSRVEVEIFNQYNKVKF